MRQMRRQPPNIFLIKPPELHAKCSLCSGSHLANYKGCLIFKQLRQKRPNFSCKTASISSKTANISSYYSQLSQLSNTPSIPGHHSQLNENSSTHSRTYANVAKGPPPINHPNPTDNNETSLFKFLDEFKSIINLLLSVLN